MSSIVDLVSNYIRYVTLETYAHATESLDKVKQAFTNILPEELRSRVPIVYEVQEGHYGNIVIIVRTFIDKKEYIAKLIEYLSRSMDSSDKSQLGSSLQIRVDAAGNLYLRFDKQLAYRGVVKLCDGDDIIRVKISFNLRAKKYGIDKLCKELGLVE